MANVEIAVSRVDDAARRFRHVVDLHDEGRLEWADAETVRLEVERLYDTYASILANMSQDEFAHHLSSCRRPL